MKLAEVKRLVNQAEIESIQQAIVSFEHNRTNLLNVSGESEGEILSHLLAAEFVMGRMKNGESLNEAVREYSKRIRSIIS